MVNDGELAVFDCWWAAAETGFFLFPKGVLSVHWEVKGKAQQQQQKILCNFSNHERCAGVL